MKQFRLIALILLGLLSFSSLYAQKERSDIRQSNRLYSEGDFVRAELGYRKAIEKNNFSFEAMNNLALSLYKQGRFEEANLALAPFATIDQKALYMMNMPINMLGDVFYNNGNAYVKQRKFEQAVEEYKKALRINPTDTMAKYNLAYAQKFIKNGGGGGGGGAGGAGGQSQNQNNDQPPPEKKQTEQKEIPQQEAESQLEAIQNQDERIKKQLDKKKSQQDKNPTGKNW